MSLRIVLLSLGIAASLFAEETPAAPVTPAAPPTDEKQFVVDPGTRIPLSLINSITTKTAAEGDRIYLETVFPILVSGKVVIPPGSYVQGTVTQVKRPGRLKGRGEIYLRFDSLILPNGVLRDFRARVGALDGRASEELDKAEGKVKSEGNKGGDAATIAQGAASGASIGAIAGAISGSTGMGVGIGAAAGAAAGLAAVLLTRGPDAVLAKGTTVEMVLDRAIQYKEDELASNTNTNRRSIGEGDGPLPSKKNQRSPYSSRYPL